MRFYDIFYDTDVNSDYYLGENQFQWSYDISQFITLIADYRRKYINLHIDPPMHLPTYAPAHGPTLFLGTINPFEWMEADKETRSNNYVIICFIFSIINSY